MATKLAEAYVQLSLRDQQLRQEMGQAKGVISQGVNELQGILGQLGGVGAGAALGFAVKFASDAQETQSKFEAVFKELTPQAEEFANNFATTIGRSMTEVRRQMGEFQDTFVPLGFARDEAAGLSQQLVALTADLASFNNMADPEVQAALTSAIVGNHEAVRRFGIIITEASLNQALLNMGIEGGTKKATEMQKVQARLNIIMASTTDAQGDALRTADGYANRLKAFQGAAIDASVAIGNVLLPSLSNFLGVGADTMRWLVTWNDQMDGLPARAATAAGAIAVISGAMRTYTMITGQAITVTKLFQLALIGTGIGAIVVGLGTAIPLLADFSQKIAGMPQVQDAWFAATVRIQEAWNSLKEILVAMWQPIQETIGPFFEWFIEKAKEAFGDIDNTAASWTAAVIGYVSEFIADALEWFQVLVTNWRSVVDILKQAFVVYVNVLRDNLTENIPNLFSWGAGRAARFVMDTWLTLAKWALNLWKNIGQAILDFFTNLPGTIYDLITGQNKMQQGLAAAMEGAMEFAIERARKSMNEFGRGFSKEDAPKFFMSEETEAEVDELRGMIRGLADEKERLEEQRHKREMEHERERHETKVENTKEEAAVAAEEAAKNTLPEFIKSKHKDKLIPRIDIEEIHADRTVSGTFEPKELHRRLQEMMLQPAPAYTKEGAANASAMMLLGLGATTGFGLGGAFAPMIGAAGVLGMRELHPDSSRLSEQKKQTDILGMMNASTEKLRQLLEAGFPVAEK